ncbi:MAG: DUF4199 domain-containing protein [Bacteroidetes bacterium]|nr:DUF4199 domain-containing protein [Bacteroidota bacterium]
MKNIKIEIKWAIAFVIMMLLWMVLEKLTGLHDVHIDKHAFYSNFVMIPAIAFYVFALLDKRKNFYDGTMSYKQGFISGLIITIIVTIVSPLTQYITSTYITPDYFNNVIKYSVEKGMMTQTEAENYFNLNSYMIQAVIGTPFMGLITTAIVALFTKRNRKIII